MKKSICFLYILLLLVAPISCRKIPDNAHGSLILAGMGYSKGTSIICINLDSGIVVNSTPIDGYMVGSTMYDPATGGYGYLGQDSVFRLIDPETGTLITSIKLPGFVFMGVIDSEDNMLIGLYTTIHYEDDPDTTGTKKVIDGPPVYTNYVVRANLSTGEVVSQKVVDLGNGVNISCYFFNTHEEKYVLERDDQYLISVNPSTGVMEKEVFVGRHLTNAVYNPDNNTVISIPYSLESDRNFVVVTNAETGAEISSEMVDKEDGYALCVSGYDPVNNWYITENAGHEILFYDISTGETVKTFKPEFTINEIKLWRE
jgi:hypothetical protein